MIKNKVAMPRVQKPLHIDPLTKAREQIARSKQIIKSILDEYSEEYLHEQQSLYRKNQRSKNKVSNEMDTNSNDTTSDMLYKKYRILVKHRRNIKNAEEKIQGLTNEHDNEHHTSLSPSFENATQTLPSSSVSSEAHPPRTYTNTSSLYDNHNVPPLVPIVSPDDTINIQSEQVDVRTTNDSISLTEISYSQTIQEGLSLSYTQNYHNGDDFTQNTIPRAINFSIQEANRNQNVSSNEVNNNSTSEHNNNSTVIDHNNTSTTHANETNSQNIPPMCHNCKRHQIRVSQCMEIIKDFDWI